MEVILLGVNNYIQLNNKMVLIMQQIHIVQCLYNVRRDVLF